MRLDALGTGVDLPEQDIDSAQGEIVDGLLNGGESRQRPAHGRRGIEADDLELLGHPATALPGPLQDRGGRQVVGGEDTSAGMESSAASVSLARSESGVWKSTVRTTGSTPLSSSTAR